MFDNLKVNNFYNKLKKGIKIFEPDFNKMSLELKHKIQKDERFAEYIDFNLILKKEEDKYILDQFWLENLSEKDLITLFSRLSECYLIDKVDLSNVFLFLKKIFLSTGNNELKNKISQILFDTVKNTYYQDYEYIKGFVKIFEDKEILYLLENETMFKFITYTLKGNDFYGYSNYFENILNNISNEEIKYEIMHKTIEYMPKTPNVKSLFLKKLKELNENTILKILNDEKIILEFQYKDDNKYFCYQELLEIVNKIDVIESKKKIIKNYFTTFPYITNVIKDLNSNFNKNESISGQTIIAFAELGLITEDIDTIIINCCKDHTLFEYLSKIDNKKEKLLEIPNDVQMDLLFDFANEQGINLFDETFAKKFAFNDEYFKKLSKENATLIKYYNGKSIELYLEKLSMCDKQKIIIQESNFLFKKDNISQLINYCENNNINIYTEYFAQKFSIFDEFYKKLTKEKIDLLRYYNGNNIDLFLEKLTICENKLRILFDLNNNIKENILQESLNQDYFNEYEKNVIKELLNIKDEKIKNVFQDYIIKNYNQTSSDKLKYISYILTRLSATNSLEMANFKVEIANQLLKSDNPEENLNKLEQIFIRNNLPVVGKVFSTFEILHPNFIGYDFSENSNISPVLKSKSTFGKKVTIFSDLLKAALGSNNRSLKDYINNLEQGNTLYKLLLDKKIIYNDLDNDKKIILTAYRDHLYTLYNNSTHGKAMPIKTSYNVAQDIENISVLLNNDDLPNHIVKMFCHFAGFDTINELKDYMNKKLEEKEHRNDFILNSNITLNQGDLIKGIRDINFLKNILQNGSVAKDFLGASSGSDMTPLDTDLAKVTICTNNFEDTIKNTLAINYGPIYLVLKNDERFVTTRDDNFVVTNKNLEIDQYELFCTGKNGHYGIRTGFASTDIDYIISEKNDSRIGLELALNGFYIPVVDMKGNLIFTKKDYENLRNKMMGLTYYGVNNYTFSNYLFTPEIEKIVLNLSESRNNQLQIKNKIYQLFEETLKNYGLKIKNNVDGNLSEGTVEIIDTGSTGRETNLINDGDYDFIVRFDKSILLDDKQLSSIKRSIINSFESIDEPNIYDGNFRFKGVKLPTLTNAIDIDITFSQKTNKINYSTDSAIKDRLKLINNLDSNKYDFVIANIILAKQILKDAGVYKPNRGSNPEGGLGGVGVENWILQHGGSFIEAATSFLEVSNGKNFEEFKNNYKIWDFGENYLSRDKNIYTHDEFVSNNMDEKGYIKMQQVLKDYLEQEIIQENTVKNI